MVYLLMWKINKKAAAGETSIILVIFYTIEILEGMV